MKAKDLLDAWNYLVWKCWLIFEFGLTVSFIVDLLPSLVKENPSAVFLIKSKFV